MKGFWIVWHSHLEKGEGVIFDNKADADATAHGDFEQRWPAIGEVFFDNYSSNAPLPIEEVEIDPALPMKGDD